MHFKVLRNPFSASELRKSIDYLCWQSFCGCVEAVVAFRGVRSQRRKRETAGKSAHPGPARCDNLPTVAEISSHFENNLKKSMILILWRNFLLMLNTKEKILPAFSHKGGPPSWHFLIQYRFSTGSPTVIIAALLTIPAYLHPPAYRASLIFVSYHQPPLLFSTFFHPQNTNPSTGQRTRLPTVHQSQPFPFSSISPVSPPRSPSRSTCSSSTSPLAGPDRSSTTHSRQRPSEQSYPRPVDPVRLLRRSTNPSS